MSPKFYFCLSILSLSLNVHAQVWTLREVVVYALDHNPNVRHLEAKQTLHDLQYEAQKSQFLPQGAVSMHADVDNNQNGLFERHGKRAGVTPNLTWRLPTGTVIQGQLTQFVEKQDRLLNQTQWKLSFEQPLLKGLDWQSNQYGLYDAKQSKILANHQHKQARSQVIYTVLNQYAHLSQAYAWAEIQQAHYEKHLHFKQIVKKKIELGLVSEVDGMLLDLQTAKFKQMIEQSNWQIEQLSAGLVQMMGGDWVEPIQVEPKALELKGFEMPESAQSMAIDYHTHPYDIELALAKRQERKLCDEHRWDLSLKAFVSKGRQQYQTNPFEFEPYEHVHANSQKYVGLYLTVPLNQDKQANLQRYQNKLNQQILQTEQQSQRVAITSQLHQSQKHLEHSLSQLEIASMSYEIAVKTKEIIQEKYLAGYASGLDFQQAQTQALLSQMDVQTAQKQIFLAQVELMNQAGLLPELWSQYV